MECTLSGLVHWLPFVEMIVNDDAIVSPQIFALSSAEKKFANSLSQLTAIYRKSEHARNNGPFRFELVESSEAFRDYSHDCELRLSLTGVRIFTLTRTNPSASFSIPCQFEIPAHRDVLEQHHNIKRRVSL